MVSVRATIEPLTTAIGDTPVIFVGALSGLPIINQALTLPPLSLRNLLEVIGTTPVGDVLRALKQQATPTNPPSRSPNTPQQGPPPKPVPPVITNVMKDASGNYEVKGSKFLPNHAVHIRVVNANTLQSDFYQATSDSSGNLDTKLTLPSLPAGTSLAFSANDERADPSDLTGTLWSNTFPISV
jgi:hypothetical protein